MVLSNSWMHRINLLTGKIMDTQDIKREISYIDSALAWIRRNKPEQYQQKFLQLIPLKCELNKILKAQEENPAIAAYGESQKGKSYLMGNLLQKGGTPFKINCKGEEYDFVARINPIGDKREATGVVTRFTSCEGHEERFSGDYPARMKVMSVANIVTILVDGYFNDLIDDQRYSDKEIQDRADRIYNQYSNGVQVQNNLTEDHVIDIKLYLDKFVNKAKVSAFCYNTDYFNKIALVIRNIPSGDWPEVFSVLWHDNASLTDLFRRMINCLSRMNFAEVVYLPIEALLHKGDNKNTIMSVDCLNGLYPNIPDPARCTSVFVKDGESYKEIRGFDKSELSALCLEISFKVDVKYLDAEAKFDYRQENDGKVGCMSKATYDRLTNYGKNEYVSKRSLLEVSDLLDFPGAKNREQMKEATLDTLDPETKQTNLVKLYLRGKVSFLFNYFSDSKALNILMFCHNAEDVKVTQMYNVIDDWIKKYVGETPKMRAETIRLAGGIAPFFAIGTMFNIDMTKKSNPDANSEVALRERWKGRFSKVMYQDCFHAGTDVDWFKNWTGNDIPFNNVYVLRDYKYSGCDGQGNNLFRGYDENVENPRESELALPEDYYNRIRSSFVNDQDNVRKFINNPDVAWEATATLNNDGALYIIKNLCVVAKNMNTVRQSQFDSRASKIAEEILEKIRSFHISEDNGDKLKRNVAIGSHVHLEFDVSSSDNSFFGRFIDMLQISDDEAYAQVHSVIESPDLIENVNRIPEIEIIRRRLPECESVSQVLQCVADIYRLTSADAARQYLEDKGIDPTKLLEGESSRNRTNSYVIANTLLSYWKDKLSSANFLAKVTANSRFDMGVMSDLISNIIEMTDTIDLVGHMSGSISEYVNVLAIGSVNEFLVADILRHIINTFVTDFGFTLDGMSDKLNELKMLAQNEKIPIEGYIDRPEPSSYTEEELTDLFNSISTSADLEMRPFFSHYNRWLEYMFLSFLATSGNITVIANREENDKIGDIISGLEKSLCVTE